MVTRRLPPEVIDSSGEILSKGRSRVTPGGMGIGTLPTCDKGAKEEEKARLSVRRSAASRAYMVQEVV